MVIVMVMVMNMVMIIVMIMVRLWGLGGRMVMDNMFDSGMSDGTIAGSDGFMWPTFIQVCI